MVTTIFMQIYSVKQQQVGAKRIIKHAVWGGKKSRKTAIVKKISIIK